VTFKANLGLISLSIVLTLSFWLQTVLLKEQDAVVAFPLIILNSSSLNVPLKSYPSEVKFRVRGLGYEILKLRFKRVDAQIDARYFEKSAVDLSTADYKIALPLDSNVEIMGLVSQTLGTSYSSRKTAQSDKWAASSMLKKGLHLTGISADVKGSNVSASVTKVIGGVPIQPERALAFFPSTVTVRIKGTINSIKNITPNQIKVSLNKPEARDNQIPLQISLPNGIVLIDYSPKYVSIVEPDDAK